MSRLKMFFEVIYGLWKTKTRTTVAVSCVYITVEGQFMQESQPLGCLISFGFYKFSHNF